MYVYIYIYIHYMYILKLVDRLHLAPHAGKSRLATTPCNSDTFATLYTCADPKTRTTFSHDLARRPLRRDARRPQTPTDMAPCGHASSIPTALHHLAWVSRCSTEALLQVVRGTIHTQERGE